MGVQKFRRVEEMDDIEVSRDFEHTLRRLDYVWALTAALSLPRPQGVKKFRSAEEADADRASWVAGRARRLRAGGASGS